MEKTLVLVKPDGVQRGLIGDIIHRFEQRGLKLIGAKFMPVNLDLAQQHYAIHLGKPFYDSLIDYITAAPVMAMVWTGPDAIEAVRQTIGATAPLSASPGSIRHDLSLQIGRNLVHASDSAQTSAEEIKLWFDEREIVDWKRDLDRWYFE